MSVPENFIECKSCQEWHEPNAKMCPFCKKKKKTNK